MTTASRQQNYITTVRQQSELFWKAYLFLQSAQDEWVAQDYTSNLADGIDGNEGITASMISDVVNTTTDAITGLMNSGHAGNITSLLD